METLANHDKFCIHMARKYHRAFGQRYVELDDLIQEARIGFVRALEDYDPTKGAITTYSSYWIRVSIQRFVKRNMGIFKHSDNLQIRKLDSCFSEAEKECLRSDKDLSEMSLYEAIAEKTGCKIKYVIEVANKRRAWTSLDKKIGDDKYSLIDHVECEGVNQEQAYVSKEEKHMLRETLKQCKSFFKQRDIDIFERRFMNEECTLQSIGDEYGVTRERVRQIEAKVLDKFKNLYLKNIAN